MITAAYEHINTSTHRYQHDRNHYSLVFSTLFISISEYTTKHFARVRREIGMSVLQLGVSPCINPMYLKYQCFPSCFWCCYSYHATISCKQGVPQTTPAASKFGTLVIDVNRHTFHYSPLIEFNMHVFRFVAKGSPALLRFVAPFSLRVAHLCLMWVLKRCIPAYLLSLVLVGAIPTSAHASR